MLEVGALLTLLQSNLPEGRERVAAELRAQVNALYSVSSSGRESLPWLFLADAIARGGDTMCLPAQRLSLIVRSPERLPSGGRAPLLVSAGARRNAGDLGQALDVFLAYGRRMHLVEPEDLHPLSWESLSRLHRLDPTRSPFVEVWSAESSAALGSSGNFVEVRLCPGRVLPALGADAWSPSSPLLAPFAVLPEEMGATGANPEEWAPRRAQPPRFQTQLLECLTLTPPRVGPAPLFFFANPPRAQRVLEASEEGMLARNASGAVPDWAAFWGSDLFSGCDCATRVARANALLDKEVARPQSPYFRMLFRWSEQDVCTR